MKAVMESAMPIIHGMHPPRPHPPTPSKKGGRTNILGKIPAGRGRK